MFGRKLDRPWLSPSGTAGFTRDILPIKVVHAGEGGGVRRRR